MKIKTGGTEFSDCNLNYVWGCEFKCAFCYAKRYAIRFAGTIYEKEKLSFRNADLETYRKLRNFEPVFLTNHYEKPILKKAKFVFVNSMSEPAFWEDEWWKLHAMKFIEYPEKKFMIFTKDIRLLAIKDKLKKYLTAFENVMIVFSVTRQYHYDILMDMDLSDFGSLKFGVAFEPLHEKIHDYCVEKFDWIMIGQETGNRPERVKVTYEMIKQIVENNKVRPKLWVKSNLFQQIPEIKKFGKLQNRW